jgi:hypothetical protein
MFARVVTVVILVSVCLWFGSVAYTSTERMGEYVIVRQAHFIADKDELISLYEVPMSNDLSPAFGRIVWQSAARGVKGVQGGTTEWAYSNALSSGFVYGSQCPCEFDQRKLVLRVLTGNDYVVVVYAWKDK